MAQIKLGQILHTNTTGEPLGTTGGKLHVKASDIEDALALLATEATLDDVKTALTGLAGAAATETTLAALKTLFDNGTAKMQLSGREVQTMSVFSAVELRDTSAHLSSDLDLSDVDILSVHVRNTHNQNVLLRFQERITGVLGSTVDTKSIDDSAANITIPASGTWDGGHIIAPENWGVLRGKFTVCRMVISASVAPTTGSITVVIAYMPK